MSSRPRRKYRYWTRRENRRAFVRELGRKLGYRRPEDWYQLDLSTLRAHGGQGLSAPYHTVSGLLKDCMPEYEWKDWLFKSAPKGTWDKRENRRGYLEWLGEKLGFRRREDFYCLRAVDLWNNKGHGLLRIFPSPIALVKDAFPEHEWLEWFFEQTPRRFWRDRANCRRYLEWLGEKLGFEDQEDWYRLTGELISRNHGASLGAIYGRDPLGLMTRFFPEHEWLPWKFTSVSYSFWADRENCQRLLIWLGERLGYGKYEDWYQVSQKDFTSNHCGGFLQFVGGGPVLALETYFPEYDWLPWRFAHQPKEIWSDPDTCTRYLDWLGAKLGFKEPEDWYRLTCTDVHKNHGRTLLRCFGSSLVALMEYYLPEHKWLEWRFAAPVPRGFWDDSANCRRYLEWLGQELGLRRLDDWYDISMSSLKKARGMAALVLRYRSLSELLPAAYPEVDWLEWKFVSRPRYFWRDPVRRRRYLEWLGIELRLTRPEDWLRLERVDFLRGYGRGLLELYGNSISRILSENLPDYHPVHDLLDRPR